MADIRRIRTVWDGIAGTPFLTTTFFTALDGTTDDCITFMDAFWSAMASRINSALSWTVLGDVEVLEDTTGVLTGFESGSSQGGNGTDPASLLSLGTCGQLNLLTSTIIGGRRLRGKLYVPGPTENQSLDGTPMPAYDTALTDALAAAETAGGPANFGVWHRPGATPGDFSPADAAQPAQYWARLTTRQR